MKIINNNKFSFILNRLNILLRILLFILIIYFYNIGFIDNNRMLRFIIVISIILSFIVLFKFFNRIIENYVLKIKEKYMLLKYKERQQDKNYLETILFIKKIVKILLKIYILINPIMFIIVIFSRKVIYFFRYINKIFFKYYFLRKLII